MRRAERFVQIKMHNIEPHVARPRQAQNRIGIGAVIIYEPAGVMDDFGHFTDIFFEQSQRAGIRQHQSRSIRSYGRF